MKENRKSLRGMVYAAMFGAATAVGAFIIIPFPLVPITLQTLFMNLAGALLGGRLGALSQVIYLILGVIGLPVFAGGKGGIGVLFGPTGGYLTGFIAAAYLLGRMIEARQRPGLAWIMLSMGAGMIVIYFLGVIQLSIVADFSMKKAVSVGMIPFLPGDVIKIIAAAVIAFKLRDRIKIRGK